MLYLTYVTVGGKIFARSLPLLRAKLAPYLKVPGVSVRTARTGAIQDIQNNSLPGLAAITSNGSGVWCVNGLLNNLFYFLFFILQCHILFSDIIMQYFRLSFSNLPSTTSLFFLYFSFLICFILFYSTPRPQSKNLFICLFIHFFN